MPEISGQLKQLFQQEFSKLVAVISRLLGLQYIDLAEDIVSETFLLAAETWSEKGLPENPTAWLYTVARRETLSFFRRNKIYQQKVIPQIKDNDEGSVEIPDVNFSFGNIRDSQLQMLFAVCNPAIASEGQIGLALRILCGFGIDEIAEAFLTNKETINKRLYRAKEKLRIEKVPMELPPEKEMVSRLDSVLHIIYLLFNEGYYSKTQNQILRKDLCLEAMRLCVMLTEHEPTNRPNTNALMALMCFHASRFGARQNPDSDFSGLILYDQQDEDLWDKDLIGQGVHFLNLSAQGDEISSYHPEARIAYWHCTKEDTGEKWLDILQLYDLMLQVNYSPNVALNRIFALYKVQGAKAALAEAKKLRLENNHFYFILLGELYKNIDDEAAKLNFQRAYALAKTRAEKHDILEKINRLP